MDEDTEDPGLPIPLFEQLDAIAKTVALHRDPFRMAIERASFPILKELDTIAKMVAMHRDPFRTAVEQAMASLPVLKELDAIAKTVALHRDPFRTGIEQAMASFPVLKELDAIAKTVALHRNPFRTGIEQAMASVSAVLTAAQRSTQALERLSTSASRDEADGTDGELAPAAVVDVPVAEGPADDIHTSLRALTAAIVALQASQASSAIKTALTAVVLPLLVSIIMAVLNPIADHYVRKSLPLERKEQPDVLAQLLAASASSPADLQRIRIVTSNVRVRGRWPKNAPVIARLQAGQVVLVLGKHRRACLVAFSTASGSRQGYGWVACKRLRSIS